MAEVRAENLPIDVEGLQKIEKKGHMDDTSDGLSVSEEHWSDDTYSDYEGQKLSCGSIEMDCDDVNASNFCNESRLAPDTSLLMVHSIESEQTIYNREGEPSVSEPTWLEGEESLAMWVKWRGKWQAGVRCARADWPLATLRAKPTHDRKNYFVIFFPHTRNYSWADTLLVRSIDEFPEPIIHKTHRAGLKAVRDLTIARRFIMKKIAVSILNIVDQLHLEALIESARDMMSWKDFAMEVSRSNGYCDLGRMLIKLQSMILTRFINSDWSKHSLQSWVQRCQDAQTAENVETLKEALEDSLLWTEINAYRDESMHPTFCSEWKTCKQEVMKWFSLSGSLSSCETMELQTHGTPSSTSQILGRKRPKLEIRRAEPQSLQVESNYSEPSTTLQIDSRFSNSKGNANGAELESGSCKEEASRVVTSTEWPRTLPNKWDEIADETGNLKSIPPIEAESTPIKAIVVATPLDTVNRNRQCIAFIESKGRQCVRWANEGDVYCCVHLSTRFSSNSSKRQNIMSADAPMCQGTTVLGTKCKHRSLYGSSFCKKHGPMSEMKSNYSFTENRRKRKNMDILCNLESTEEKAIVLVGDVESPLQVEPLSIGFSDNLERHPSNGNNATVALQCIGSGWQNENSSCAEIPKRHSLYCEKHLPSWLKRARNGKSRIVSKEVFMELLGDCRTQEVKIHLHQACELFYKLFKSILSLRNPVPKDVQFQWALSEASKNTGVKALFIKLVLLEKTRLTEIWGFGGEEYARTLPSSKEEPAQIPLIALGCSDDETSIRCKICSEVFTDDRALSTHFVEGHKKEAQWLFRGYACAICLDSFTNKKVLESHMQDRHHVSFVEQCMLIQCIPCGSHFGNTEQLWLHVLSVHHADFRLSKLQKIYASAGEDSPKKHELNSVSLEKSSENIHGERKFICRLCGLKFDLLPDLGRHHQAAHMDASLDSNRPSKRGIHYYAYKMKSGRLSRPRFKKSFTAASYHIRNRANVTVQKRVQASKLLQNGDVNEQKHGPQLASIGRLIEPQCSSIAQILFSQIQKTKPHPTSFDIFETACSACCKITLKAMLENKYGLMPENLYLKAAKLCSENNFQVEWHLEGFNCPKGCKVFKECNLSPLTPSPNDFIHHESRNSPAPADVELETDECHYIIDSHLLRRSSMQKGTILCQDISFGLESVPVVCMADEGVLNSLQIGANSSPWEGFTYVTKPILDESLVLDTECFQLGCGCSDSACRPELCDHVYLFDNDFDDARDIFGKRMCGRFPYNDKGRLILEEGYLVYECNQKCSCSRTCPNRILQNGIRAKLEVFLTEKKEWAVRAGETILRGTFVCEYIGEILNDDEAKTSYERHVTERRYFLDVDAHTNDMSRLVDGLSKYVIDATKFGNVSRFINQSCTPNLTNYQVLVESMDYHQAHIGLYANRDITVGEELTFDYRYKVDD